MTRKELYSKHASKLLKGFDKQCKRQRAKPETKKIKLNVAIQLPKNFKGKYKHHLKVYNSKWNGMNLIKLRNRLQPLKSYNNMYSKFSKDSNGIVRLSRYGKQILEKKKLANS